ncbi:MAG: serine/threonine protein kinase [Polyangiales bacterium]
MANTGPIRVGDYELEAPLGRGGMAETYIAVRRGDGGFEQRVCLKRILPAYADDEEFLRSFQEEVRVSAKLRHTNIAQILDFGTGANAYLALELIEGCNLHELLHHRDRSKEPLPAGLVAYIAHELGQALAYAHQSGVVHRDISPSNILVSHKGEVKLTDFGIARARDRTRMTKEGLVKGKIPYMAPEYAQGAEANAQTDLFSLGVTLYEAASLRRPFRAKNSVALLRALQTGERPPLLSLVDLPAELADAIEGCLAPDPKDRPTSARAFLRKLEKVPAPPTARRLLGRALPAHRGEPAKVVTPEALAQTEVVLDTQFTPATEKLEQGLVPHIERVIQATPDAETRTRVALTTLEPTSTPDGPNRAPLLIAAGALIFVVSALVFWLLA